MNICVSYRERAVVGALPSKELLANRLHLNDTMCPICGLCSESIRHIIFECQHARAAWFASPIGYRPDDAPPDLAKWILLIGSQLTTDDLTFSLSLMWEIWKARNECVFRGARPSPIRTIIAARGISSNYIAPIAHQSVQVPTRCPGQGDIVCWVDASWRGGLDGSMGIFVCRHPNQMVLAQSLYQDFCESPGGHYYTASKKLLVALKMNRLGSTRIVNRLFLLFIPMEMVLTGQLILLLRSVLVGLNPSL